MKNSTLDKIASLLKIQLQQSNTIDCVEGKIKVVFFFYLYAKYSKIKEYNDIADSILDKALESIETHYIDCHVYNNLAEIAWGLRYLDNNSLIEVDAEIYEDMENVLYSNNAIYIDYTTNNDALLYSGIYLTEVLKSKKINQELLIIYNQYVYDILNSYEYYFLTIYDNKKKSLSSINSILFLLIELYKRDIYITKCTRLLWRILNYLTNWLEVFINDKNDNNCVLYELIYKIPVNGFDRLKNNILNKLASFVATPHFKGNNVNSLWQQFIYFPNVNKKSIISDKELNTYIGRHFLGKETVPVFFDKITEFGLLYLKYLSTA
jgi:hypothetical protein